MFYDARHNRRLYLLAARAAVISAVAVVVWIITMVVYRVPEGTNADQLHYLAQTGFAAGIPYLNACLLSLMQIPIFVALYFLLRRAAPITVLVGSLAGIIYAVYNTAAYWIQLAMVTRLPELHRQLADPALQAAVEQHFFLFASFQQHTPVYALDQLGYFLLALASLLLGVVLQKSYRAAGYTLLTSGICGLAGAVGYLAAAPQLEFGNVLSGMVYFFFLVLVAIVFWQEAVTGKAL